MFKIGAFAMIFDPQQRVLLCLRTDFDAWNLPGGGVESGELPTEGVIREVKEETGLEVEVTRLIAVYGKPHRDELVFSFICRSIGGQLSATEESRECRFFEINQLPANTISNHVERIYDALEIPDVPVFRRQPADPLK
ncbi:MAG: NUDIX domain-containing protein [Cyanobacteria bacterium J06642_11]